MILQVLEDGVVHDWPARELSGYHRPLSGEVANLTMVLDIAFDQRVEWQTPRLGAPARVMLDSEILLDGTLTRVVWTASDLTVTVEG